MKGVLGGMFWGLVAVLAGLGAVSLLAPLPVTPPEAGQNALVPGVAVPPVAAPTAPKAPAATPVPDAGAVLLPGVAEMPPPRAPGTPGTVTQPGTAQRAAAMPDTTPAAAPEQAATPGASATPDVSDLDAPKMPPDVSAHPRPVPGGMAPSVAAPEAAPVSPATPPAPSMPEKRAEEPAPDVPDTPETPPVTLPPTPSVTPGDAPSSGALRRSVPGQEIKVPDVRVGRLPTIGGATPTPAAETPEPASQPALIRYAAPFQPKGDAPLFSVILIDEGDRGLDRAALTTFTFPVTFAIDAARADAADAMRAYRAAGFEVVLMAGGLPQGATPQDLEVALGRYLQKMPQTVAIMDAETGGFQSNRPLLRQLMAIIKETGQGVITFDKGLNAAEQVARAEGVPAALVFRTLDAQHEPVTTIRRYLDRAAFKAGQDGHVIMVGHTYPETVTALFSWALEGEGSNLNIAPVSAILRGQ